MDLIKLIKDNRPNLKPNSLRSYLITLKILNDNEEIKNLNYLKKTKDIMEKINKYALPTKRNKLTALLVVLTAFNKEEFDPAEEFYRKQLEDLNGEYNEYISTHSKSEKQETNWITLDELKKIMKKHKKEAKLNPTISNYQKYLVSALYLLNPPKRLDFANMKIIKDRKENNEEDNYLLNLGRNKKYFIFNQFKTKEKHGKKEVLISKELNSIINNWLKINTSEHFLLNSRGQAMTPNGLGKYITMIFKGTGKKITVNLLRNIFISENIDLEAIKKQKQIANEMDHATNTQQSVYLKKD